MPRLLISASSNPRPEDQDQISSNPTDPISGSRGSARFQFIKTRFRQVLARTERVDWAFASDQIFTWSGIWAFRSGGWNWLEALTEIWVLPTNTFTLEAHDLLSFIGKCSGD